MGKLGGFLEIERVGQPERDPRERVGDYREFLVAKPQEELAAESAGHEFEDGESTGGEGFVATERAA